MLFNSTTFLIFFLIVFLLYWFVLNKKLIYQNILLLIGSYVFYGWWDWRYLILIFISSLSVYLIGQKIQNAKYDKVRKRWLLLSLFINLGILGFFKYFNFFIESWVTLLENFNVSANTYTLNILLPVGISFYTFQSLSYTLDIYNKKLVSAKDVISFFTFVAFFPQLVAGPIERAKHLLPQFNVPRKFQYNFAITGARLVIWGFFKKVAVADNLAILVDAVYSQPESYIGAPMVLATFFFAIQIYCDFSGYSDIAIGISRMLGFDLMTNFKLPYFSKSLTEFWRRWHISLSSWFRDYLYIPLGGSQGNHLRVSFNIFITFLISGLWHGANWTFVIWGAIHGAMLIIEKRLSGIIKWQSNNYIIGSISVLITFIIISFTWIFFRSNTVSEAFFIIKNMFSDIDSYGNLLELSLKFRGMGLKESDLIYSFIFILILFVIELAKNVEKLNLLAFKYRVVRWSIYYLLLGITIMEATKNNAVNFIYFQF